MRPHLVADIGVAEHRQRHLIKLRIAATRCIELGQLLAENASQIGEECLVGVIGARLRKRGAAPEMKR